MAEGSGRLTAPEGSSPVALLGRLVATVRSPYELKKLLLSPRTRWMRRRETTIDQFGRAMLELHYYRPTIYAFIRAAERDPEILVTAEIDESSVVVDAGAYVGEWSERIAARYGSTIYAFEPSPHACRRLRRAVEGRPGIEVFGFGLSDRDEVVSLAIDGPGSSAFSGVGAFGVAEVPLRDVVGVFEELGIEEIDLLKVNIEGGEYPLFDRLIEAGWLERIRTISVQFHEWIPGAYRHRRRIRRALRQTHEEVWNYPWVWEVWRRDGPRDRSVGSIRS